MTRETLYLFYLDETGMRALPAFTQISDTVTSPQTCRKIIAGNPKRVFGEG
jgi:hypothetical protein